MPYIYSFSIEMDNKKPTLFNWDDSGVASEKLLRRNKKIYQLKIRKIRGNYRVDLLEDNDSVLVENTSNKTFRKHVDINLPVETQVLYWGTHMLRSRMGICDLCKERKIVQRLSKYDKSLNKLKGLKVSCKKCRDEVYNDLSHQQYLEQQQRDQAFLKELEKEPPVIVGGFKKKIDAYKYLLKVQNPDRTELGDGYVYVKGILKVSNGTFYPAFLGIQTPGGEHWETDLISSNLSINVPDYLALNFIKNYNDDFFPYEYETLAHIEGDFHQKSWFGTIYNNSVKHHLTNRVILDRKENWEDIEETVRVQVRSYFSIQHLLSASFMLKEVQKYEQTLSYQSSDHELLAHRAYVVSVILACASFLEATINELFMDAGEGIDGVLNDLNKNTVKLYAKMWKKGVPRTANYTIIDKYQIALTLANKPEFKLGDLNPQNVILLVKMRNALVHFEPESVVTKDVSESSNIKRQKLEQQLAGRFELNPFTGVDNPFFPDKCLSSDCAKWVLSSCFEFTNTFFLKLGILPTYQKIKYLIENSLTND